MTPHGWTPGRVTGLPEGTDPARVGGGLLTVLAVAVLSRCSVFTRTVAGRRFRAQVVAADLETVLVVDALAGAARLRRIERCLAVAWGSGATPVVVLTKADLCDDVPAAVAQVAEDALGVEVLAVSPVTGEGVGTACPPAPPPRR